MVSARWAFLMVLLAGMLAGCGSARKADYIKPTIAVMKFDNRAPFPYKWDIGGGTKEVLTDRLVKTGRYQVIERPELESILREIHLQNSGLTRPQDRARLGQLKNVQYLIKGTITDFAHVGGANGGAKGNGWSVSGSNSMAIIAMTLYVVNVESGEIICSERIQETVNAGGVDFRGTYKDISFGGSIFYKTPLGKATARAIDRAVDSITDVVATRRWQPRIASVDGRKVVINGGAARGVAVGDELEIMAAGKPIIDPDTGDVLARHPDQVAGRVRIIEVHDAYSLAEVQEGADLEVGMICRRVTR